MCHRAGRSPTTADELMGDRDQLSFPSMGGASGQKGDKDKVPRAMQSRTSALHAEGRACLAGRAQGGCIAPLGVVLALQRSGNTGNYFFKVQKF